MTDTTSLSKWTKKAGKRGSATNNLKKGVT